MNDEVTSLWPFQADSSSLSSRLDEYVAATFADLQSQFLTLPRSANFVEYGAFQHAYEVLKRRTSAFSVLSESIVWSALQEDALTLVVLRTILGFTPPEWADLARTERGSDVSQGFARNLDARCRSERGLFNQPAGRQGGKLQSRVAAMVSIAVEYISRGVPPSATDVVHRLNKVDTAEGLPSLQHVAAQDVPYAVLLYERYLGRPFASHRDSISELVGEVMESAIEERLARARISFRKTRRAERVPGFDQAPDFFVPDEFSPAVVIEAKITGDDGTARDKTTRIIRLAEMSRQQVRDGGTGFQVIACIDGRGFGVRREDMRQMLTHTEGKVFTLATLDQLIEHTRLRQFLPDVVL